MSVSRSFNPRERRPTPPQREKDPTKYIVWGLVGLGLLVIGAAVWSDLLVTP